MNRTEKKVAIANALLHPLRWEILNAMADADTDLSPKLLSKRLSDQHGGDRLTNVSYHVRQLVAYDLISLTDSEPRRGALEHFYALTTLGMCALLTYSDIDVYVQLTTGETLSMWEALRLPKAEEVPASGSPSDAG